MAHLRLFLSQRGTQRLHFPAHDLPIMRTCAPPAAQTWGSSQPNNLIETAECVRRVLTIRHEVGERRLTTPHAVKKGGAGSRWRRQEPPAPRPPARLEMMSTPPPQDHRLCARGNALSKAAGPAVDQYRQWFTTTVYPRLLQSALSPRSGAQPDSPPDMMIMIRKGLGIQPQ